MKNTSSEDVRKVLVVNSYSMRSAYELWRAGRSQEHHLWGASRIDDSRFLVDYSACALDISGLPSRSRLIRRFSGLVFQLRVVRDSIGYDAVYFPNYTAARLSSLFRLIGLSASRLIVVIHYPLRDSLIDRILLRGVDRILFLSRHTQLDVLRSFPENKNKSSYAGWAADMDFYEKVTPIESNVLSADGPLRIIAAGKDTRDYQTLADCVAHSDFDIQVKIFCSGTSRPVSADPRVSIISSNSSSNPLPIFDLISNYAVSDVIAIPLKNVDRVAGLTSLIDALAIGKFVLCTRNCGIDIDIEAIGCGIWVDADDSRAWARAIERVILMRSELSRLGGLGKTYAKSHLSMDKYGEIVSSALKAAF